MAKKVKKAATTLVIVALVALLVVGGVLGAVFGISASSAKDAIEVTRDEAKIIAQGYVSLRFLTLNPVVQEINSDLEIGNKLTRKRSLQQVMQESFFYGSNRFGNNFIA